MEPQRDLAMILRVIPFEDRHQIVTALTLSWGQVTALAKNSIQSRRFGGALDLFIASEWIFKMNSGGDLWTLVEAQVLESYEALRFDFKKLSMASVLNEIMLRVAPKLEPCSNLFRLHSNALLVLSRMDSSQEIYLLNAYLAKILQWSGYQPRLQSCLVCEISLESLQGQMELNCQVQAGGWVCQSCQNLFKTKNPEVSIQGLQNHFISLTPLVIQDFYRSLQYPIREICNQRLASQEEHQRFFQFMEAFFVYHFPGFDQRPLQGLRFLNLQSSVRPQATSRQ